MSECKNKGICEGCPDFVLCGGTSPFKRIAEALDNFMTSQETPHQVVNRFIAFPMTVVDVRDTLRGKSDTERLNELITLAKMNPSTESLTTLALELVQLGKDEQDREAAKQGGDTDARG